MDGTNLLIGQANLRQLRTARRDCVFIERILTKMHNLPNKKCLVDYSSSERLTEPFGVNGTFLFTPEEELVRSGIQGRAGYYDGSGYVLQLDRTRLGALQQLKELKERGWIDENTRAVIVEFTLFNVATNLFRLVLFHPAPLPHTTYNQLL